MEIVYLVIISALLIFFKIAVLAIETILFLRSKILKKKWISNIFYESFISGKICQLVRLSLIWKEKSNIFDKYDRSRIGDFVKDEINIMINHIISGLNDTCCKRNTFKFETHEFVIQEIENIIQFKDNIRLDVKNKNMKNDLVFEQMQFITWKGLFRYEGEYKELLKRILKRYELYDCELKLED